MKTTKLCVRGSCCPTLSIEKVESVHFTLSDDDKGKISFNQSSVLAVLWVHNKQIYSIVPSHNCVMESPVNLSTEQLAVLLQKASKDGLKPCYLRCNIQIRGKSSPFVVEFQYIDNQADGEWQIHYNPHPSSLGFVITIPTRIINAIDQEASGLVFVQLLEELKVHNNGNPLYFGFNSH